jgi:large subunit ribosomal protein L5
MSRLKQRYLQEIKASLTNRFGYSNVCMVPRLEKIVLHMGIAEAAKEKNALQDCENELGLIAGQRPIRTAARISVSNFKLRQGQIIGLKATLRGKRMMDFADRFFNIASPRIRDFRGFMRKADGRGNYSLGIDDHQIFAELNLDAVKRTQGMHITFVTSANTDEECIALLEELGLPFKKA